jgi:mRNA-degrading endonuclease RelE of RelBE toxin-antitoxin system
LPTRVTKLQGIEAPEYRFRVGDWRVRFSYPDSGTVRVNRVLNRREVYR